MSIILRLLDESVVFISPRGNYSTLLNKGYKVEIKDERNTQSQKLLSKSKKRG